VDALERKQVTFLYLLLIPSNTCTFLATQYVSDVFGYPTSCCTYLTVHLSHSDPTYLTVHLSHSAGWTPKGHKRLSPTFAAWLASQASRASLKVRAKALLLVWYTACAKSSSDCRMACVCVRCESVCVSGRVCMHAHVCVCVLPKHA